VGFSVETKGVDVTYDIVFIHRDLGQSFESATQALHAEPLPDRLRGSWLERLQPVMAATFGDAQVDAAAAEPEIADPRTGLRLLIRGGGVVVEVPEDPVAGDALDLMARTYALSREIERVTGLEGWDTRLHEPISFISSDPPPPPARPAAAGKTGPDRGRRGSARPPGAGSPRPGEATGVGAAAGATPGRPGTEIPGVDSDDWAERAGLLRPGDRSEPDEPAVQADEPRRKWWRFWRR